MRTAAIIQARMRSTRLPGKVLREIGGRRLIGHTIDRLRKCPAITDVAIVTSTEPADDAIAAFAAAENVPCFRGPEDDVLGRFQLAVEALNPDRILRVTGDCPLLSVHLIENFLHQMTIQDADFLLAEAETPCIQEGVDPVSRRAFDFLIREARNDPFAREHVTSYFKKHPNQIKTGSLDIPLPFQFSGARLSVDTPADIKFLNTLEKKLGPLGQIELEDIVTLLRREPWLMTTNAHVVQKGAGDVNGTVLIRADGGGALGFGHLMRCLTLAHELRDKRGLGVMFLTGFHPAGDMAAAKRVLSQDDFPVLEAKDGADNEEVEIVEAIDRTRATHLITDIRTRLSAEALERIKGKDVTITVIDDASARRMVADLAAFPLVPGVKSLGWDGFRGRLFAGGGWTLLSPKVTAAIPHQNRSVHKQAKRLLITMGGSDPRGWTLPVVAACAGRHWPLGTVIDVIVGPGFKKPDQLVDRLNKLHGVGVHVTPPNTHELMAEADAAIVAFGVSAYELAALGVPSLYLSVSEDHRKSAGALIGAGAGIAIGGPGKLNTSRIGEAAHVLIYDVEAREAMSLAATKTVDGQAAVRLAEEIVGLMKRAAPPATQTPVLFEVRQASSGAR